VPTPQNRSAANAPVYFVPSLIVMTPYAAHATGRRGCRSEHINTNTNTHRHTHRHTCVRIRTYLAAHHAQFKVPHVRVAATKLAPAAPAAPPPQEVTLVAASIVACGHIKRACVFVCAAAAIAAPQTMHPRSTCGHARYVNCPKPLNMPRSKPPRYLRPRASRARTVAPCATGLTRPHLRMSEFRCPRTTRG
jgi:hypothetical protein